MRVSVCGCHSYVSKPDSSTWRFAVNSHMRREVDQTIRQSDGRIPKPIRRSPFSDVLIVGVAIFGGRSELVGPHCSGAGAMPTLEWTCRRKAGTLRGHESGDNPS